jgi:hypothetical protein
VRSVPRAAMLRNRAEDGLYSSLRLQPTSNLLGLVIAAGVIEQVAGDGVFNRRSPAAPWPSSLTLSRCSRRFGFRHILCRASTLISVI